MLQKYLIKIERVSSWVLFFVILIYAITGYGMTKGLIDPQISRLLHLSWLGAIGLVAFVIHTSWSISVALKRWNIWNYFTSILLAVFYIFVISFFIYVQFFYQSAEKGGKLENSQNGLNIINKTISTNVFTAEILAEYNGLNGKPAYVAIDGIVYDMSSVFINGEHKGHTAGQDLSSKFHQEHLDEFLSGYNIVGTYNAN